MHDRVQPHGDDRVERHRAGEHAVLPAGALEALGEHLQEARVGVQDREPDRGRAWRHLPRSIASRAPSLATRITG